MKKIICLLLIFMCVGLVGCSSEKPNDKTTGNDSEDEMKFTEMVVVDNDYCLIQITDLEIEKK